jgi:hypothetical protein
MRGLLVHIGELVLVFAYVSAALWGIEGLLGHAAGGLGSDLLAATAKFALFLVTLIPWALLVERRYSGLTSMWSMGTAAARMARRSIPRRA